jgi:threonine/homoserine/homoserine lactone efflux protein
MSTIDAFTAGKSALVGLLLSAVNPKNLAMSAAAGLAIAQAEISTGQEVGAAIIYVLLGSATVLGPVVVYLVEQDRAARILGEWRVWLADNNAVLTGLLLLVFAVVLIGKGISGLSS